MFEEQGFRDPELFERFGIVVVEAAWGPLGPLAPDDLPIGTINVELSYRMGDENGNEVARAHVFKKPDGTFGASGIPDPKRVLAEGVLFVLDKRLDEADG